MIAVLDTLAKTGGGYNLATGGQGPFGVERSQKTRQLISEKTTEWFEENPEARKRLSELGKRQMADPERREISRQAALAQWRDPNLSAKSQEALDNFWSQEGASELRREFQAKVMANPKARENLRQKAREQMSDPVNREKSRQGALKQWENPDYRASRYGARHPTSRCVRAEGVEYNIIKEAASAVNVSTTCIRDRIQRRVSGYEFLDLDGVRSYRPRAATGPTVSPNKWLRRFKDVHGNKYHYGKADIGFARVKIEIVCPVHGPFWQIPDNHAKGQGCRTCARKKRRNN